MKSQLRYGTSTSQIFWGYDETETGGVLGFLVDGTQNNGDTLASGNNYMGIVEVTGLSEGSHTYQATLAGTPVGQAKTFSTVPSGDIKVALWGCSGAILFENPFPSGDNPGFSEIIRQGADAHICLGDYLYLGPSTSYSMYDVGGITAASDYATQLPIYQGLYQYHYEMSIAKQRTMEKLPFVGIWDNHEIYSTALDSEVGALSAGGTTSVKDAAAKAGWDAFLKGRPTSTGTDTVPAVASGPLYTKWQWGNVEFIMLDRVSHCVNTSFALGTNQVNWAVAAIAASTAEFIVIVSPSVMRSTPIDYQTIMTAADAVGKTVIAVCSDTHASNVNFIQGAYMPAQGMLEFLFNPMNKTIGAWSDTLTGNATSKYTADDTTDRAQAFCLLETQGTTLIIKGINVYTGAIMAEFTIESGGRDATNTATPKW